jgi:hypothetical protein
MAKKSSPLDIENTLHILNEGSLFYVVKTLHRGEHTPTWSGELPNADGTVTTFRDSYAGPVEVSQRTYAGFPAKLDKFGNWVVNHGSYQFKTPRSFRADGIAQAQRYVEQSLVSASAAKVGQELSTRIEQSEDSARKATVTAASAAVLGAGLVPTDTRYSPITDHGYLHGVSRTSVQEILAALIGQSPQLTSAVVELAARYVVAKADPRDLEALVKSQADIVKVSKIDAETMEKKKLAEMQSHFRNFLPTPDPEVSPPPTQVAA